MSEKIFLVKDDICRQKVEAIVNAANCELLHGGGLAGAIVEAGGKIIQEESDRIAPIPLGEAAVTGAGKLKAKYVIHAASMRLGEQTSEENLSKAIQNCFRRAAEMGLKTIAFPAIGAGIGGFPIGRCAAISLKTALDFLRKNPDFRQVLFVLHSDKDYAAFADEYQRIVKN